MAEVKRCVCGNEMYPRDWSHEWVCKRCGRKRPMDVPMSNADAIRAMSDEELAAFIPNWSYTDACKCGEHYVACNNECEKCVLDWLRQPKEV